jgi:hypothetical protein
LCISHILTILSGNAKITNLFCITKKEIEEYKKKFENMKDKAKRLIFNPEKDEYELVDSV